METVADVVSAMVNLPEYSGDWTNTRLFILVCNSTTDCTGIACSNCTGNDWDNFVEYYKEKFNEEV